MYNSDRRLWKTCAVQHTASVCFFRIIERLMDLEAVENGAKRTIVTNKRCDPILTLWRGCQSKEAEKAPHGLFKLKTR
jgi:hypothetical protein